MPALFVALVDAEGRSVALQHAGLLALQKAERLLQGFAAFVRKRSPRDPAEGAYTVARAYRIHFVLCQRVWIVACNYAVEEIWATTTVLGQTLDYLLALCEHKVTPKRVEKSFGDVLIALLRILCTRRDAVDLARLKSVPGRQLMTGSTASMNAVATAAGQAAPPATGTATSASPIAGTGVPSATTPTGPSTTHTSGGLAPSERHIGASNADTNARLSRTDTDEARRLEIWTSLQADFVERKRQVASLRDLEERATIPSATSFPGVLESARVRAGAKSSAQRERRKKLQRQHKKAATLLRASAWEDFGDTFFVEEAAEGGVAYAAAREHDQTAPQPATFDAFPSSAADHPGDDLDAEGKVDEVAFDPFNAPSSLSSEPPPHHGGDTGRGDALFSSPAETGAIWDPFGQGDPAAGAGDAQVDGHGVQLAGAEGASERGDSFWDPFGDVGTGEEGGRDPGTESDDSSRHRQEKEVVEQQQRQQQQAEQLETLQIREQLIADGTWSPRGPFALTKCMARGKVYAAGANAARVSLRQIGSSAHALHVRADPDRAAVLDLEDGRFELECDLSGPDAGDTEHNVALFWTDPGWCPPSVPVYATAAWTPSQRQVQLCLYVNVPEGISALCQDAVAKISLAPILGDDNSATQNVQISCPGARSFSWSAHDAMVSVELFDFTRDALVAISVFEGDASEASEGAQDALGLACDLRCLLKTAGGAASAVLEVEAGTLACGTETKAVVRTSPGSA